jgi:acyl-CoA synthetase (AMP-forming)/AMP-acid ligase II
LFWRDRWFSYPELVEQIDGWKQRLAGWGVHPGMICAVYGDYSPGACAAIFALIEQKAIVVPFTKAAESEIPEFCRIAGVQCMISLTSEDEAVFRQIEPDHVPALVTAFLPRRHAGLIVFSSGSSGEPKAILHDCESVFGKFVEPRQGWRTLLFLLMDHFGGFNTLLATFAYGGSGICLPDREPVTVCRLIEQAKAELMPVTPTFLNFLLMSAVYRDYDLSSIRLITYGTEVMLPATLQKVSSAFPNARLKQTYGLSELGVLRSTSARDDSVWVRVGGDGFETKVVDGVLWVRSAANMVGYLNATTPIDADGWMCTEDQVEVDGEYLRFLGRRTDLINVGGQKVYPSEVENVLLEADNVCEAAVSGLPHALMGQVVQAKLSLCQPEEETALRERLREFCLARLPRYKVPMRFSVVASTMQHSRRYKKIHEKQNRKEECK